ncbi:MAG: InlB B-repeat-containing protein [Firmicutes bacterium]|nr:InlB B-repeat-containing protein [Bacillota bacterium]
MTAAFLVVAVLALPTAQQEAPPVETTPPTTQPPETEPPETEPTTAPTQATTLPPETLPVLETYPLGDGTIEVTVYNGSFDMAAGGDRVLFQGSFPEAEFTGMPMPEPEPQEGFQFLGFVLSGGEDIDYTVQGELTPQDAQRVAPGADGVRTLRLYGTWEKADGGEPWMPLTLDANGGNPTVSVDATGPLYSGTTVYLAAYPEPERMGYRFAGWYREPECTGEPVKRLQATEFFTRDAEGKIDWSVPSPGITLYARWIPE